MLLDAAIWGLYSIMGRVVMRNRSNLSATAFATWFALPPLLVGAALEWRTTPPDLTPAGLLGVLYIGVFAAFLAVVLWNEGVRRTGPSGAMAFYNMLPVFGALLGALFLGERLAPLQVAGAGPRRPRRIDQRPMEKFHFTAARAEHFARLALGCIGREYPYNPATRSTARPTAACPAKCTPAFYGCFDWHSAVHGHWLLVRVTPLSRSAERGLDPGSAERSPLAREPGGRDGLLRGAGPEGIRADVRLGVAVQAGGGTGGVGG